MSLQYNQPFNDLWKKGLINKPLVILIGGYAGTGKSTLAFNLSSQLNNIQIIPTGILRSIAQAQDPDRLIPSLHLPTYDLHTITASQTQKAIVQNYAEQCDVITPIINSVIKFMGTEKQHIIIEGNHIVPWETYINPNCHVIELYLRVDNKATHKLMLGGPTHNRTLEPIQIETGRIIHDYIDSEVERTKKQIFEYNNTDGISKLIDQSLRRIIKITQYEKI